MPKVIKTNILFLQHAGCGGTVVNLVRLIQQLDTNRYSPTIIFLGKDKKAIKLFHDLGVNVKVVPHLAQVRFTSGGWNNLFNPLQFYLIIKNLLFLLPSIIWFYLFVYRLKPQVIYLNSLAVFFYSIISHHLHIPTILHVQEVMKSNFGGIPAFIHKRIIECYVTMTIYIGQNEYEHLKIKSPYTIINNYVDINLWTPNRNKMISVSNDRPTILFVGGINPIKGLPFLLNALNKLKKDSILFKCVILGFDVTSRTNFLKSLIINKSNSIPPAEILSFINNNDLQDSIILKPFETNPLNSFLSADILVFPSTESHFARPIIEASAIELPVIASDFPGTQEAILNNVTGILVPPCNSNALANALKSLILNQAQRLQMGQAGRKHIEKHYNAAINETVLINIINKSVYVPTISNSSRT